ncbi:MAG: biotin--[acetyl-CoA-carboxylase] ligase, partial [Acidimicrobiales bacterium]
MEPDPAMSPPSARSTFTEVSWFEELGSTNTWLLEAAASGAGEGTVVVADRQSAGRGRLDRRWTSPAGSGLLTSLLFRPRLAPGDLFVVSALVTLAALDAVWATAGVQAGA